MSLDALLTAVPPGGPHLLASLLLIVGLLLGRSVCRGVRMRRRVGERVLILGTSPLARRVVEEIGLRRERAWAIVGVLDDPDRLDLAIAATRPDGIIVERAAETYERLTGKLPLEALPAARVVFSRDFQPSAVQLALTRLLSLV